MGRRLLLVLCGLLVAATVCLWIHSHQDTVYCLWMKQPSVMIAVWRGDFCVLKDWSSLPFPGRFALGEARFSEYVPCLLKFPLWIPFVIFAGSGTWLAVYPRRLRRRRRREGRCTGCGYPLYGIREPRCPECGRPFDPSKIISPPRESSILAWLFRGLDALIPDLDRGYGLGGRMLAALAILVLATCQGAYFYFNVDIGLEQSIWEHLALNLLNVWVFELLTVVLALAAARSTATLRAAGAFLDAFLCLWAAVSLWYLFGIHLMIVLVSGCDSLRHSTGLVSPLASDITEVVAIVILLGGGFYAVVRLARRMARARRCQPGEIES